MNMGEVNKKGDSWVRRGLRFYIQDSKIQDLKNYN